MNKLRWIKAGGGRDDSADSDLSGHLFRFTSGHDSDLKPAGVPT